MPSAGETALSLSPDRQTLEFNGIHALTQLGSHASFGERLSENSERLYESDNGVLGGPPRSAAGGRSGGP
jgi:hypothetical protein